MNKLQEAIQQVTQGQDLSAHLMEDVIEQIMDGKATSAQTAALLVGLKIKKETITEITAAAQIMRTKAEPFPKFKQASEPLIDIVGTGGDGAGLFNISTAASIIVAAAGSVKVAKHGNRSVSSKSGSADFLEQVGIEFDLSPNDCMQLLEKTNFTFLYAPIYHGSMRHVAQPRKEIAIRTIFNILGPITNPAKVKNHLIGVYAKELQQLIAATLHRLGSQRALIVHSDDGLDEISIAAPTTGIFLDKGVYTELTIDPKTYFGNYQPLDTLKITSPQDSVRLLDTLGSNHKAPIAAMCCLNAGAALFVAKTASSWQAGVEIAEQIISTGKFTEKLKEIVDTSQAIKKNAS